MFGNNDKCKIPEDSASIVFHGMQERYLVQRPDGRYAKVVGGHLTLWGAEKQVFESGWKLYGSKYQFYKPALEK